MPAVNILKFGVSSPSDVTPVDELRKAGYDPSQVIGLIGKSEGRAELCCQMYIHAHHSNR